MEKKKWNIHISDIILLAVSAVFLIGICTFFSACGPKDDGSWMTCHWAGQAVGGIAVVLVVLAFIHMVFADERIKMGISLAVIPTAALAAIIPGNVIGLCMMDTMRCHSVMRPAVVVAAIATIAAAVFDILTQRKHFNH